MKTSNLMLLLILVSVLTATHGLADQNVLRAILSTYGGSDLGFYQKPKGEARFRPGENAQSIDYVFEVENVKNVTSASIHLGREGYQGPPVAALYAGPAMAGFFSGVLARGTITANDLTGDLRGKPLDALLKLIGSGDAYVSVHTLVYPEGVIRGQIRAGN